MNRLDESLKFIEDVVRFNLENKILLKKIRGLRTVFLQVKRGLREHSIVTFRDSRQDLGRKADFDRGQRRSDEDLIIANLTRAKESARTLEEIIKQKSSAVSRLCKRLRFGLYDIESSIMDILDRRFDPRIHIILDEQYLIGKNVRTLVRMLEAQGATMFQLRIRTLSDRKFYRYANTVKQALKKQSTKFIINNRIDIALACNADGVHLGQDDVPVRTARRVLGRGTIIGASARTVTQARTAERQGADYLGVGSLFPTRTKVDARSTSLRSLRAISKQVSIPIIGVGGITDKNYRTVLRAGAAGIAVASYVLQDDTRRAMRSLTKK
ncbi:MAG: thiamine phosphate synthase [candidate division WOR-3 bacterium]|nr:MAG: thiamine phosphate synthase [candidate division WOR-3 bacterium]